MKLLTAIRLRSCKHSFLPTGQSLGFSRLLSTARECNVEALHGNDKGIFVLTLDRPAAKNALGRTLLSQFRQSINDLRFNDQARVVIVKSAVDGVFCAGADLKERAQMQPSEVAAFVNSLRAAFSELESLPMPTIAVVDGFALGGGLELALCTDLRVGGQKAKVGLPETKLAIIPGAGGTQRLCRLIGVSRAKELIFTSRVLTSSEAFDYGIVNYTVNESAYSKALEVARTMIPNGPVAMRMAKLAVHHGSQLDLASGLAFEQTCYAQVIPTQDRLEGLAAFREKRTPVYTGR
ncbi:hypothetical protein BATDEDRAFT_14474 [Batrachochytrium dendrobatidis JAM81]|uniref:Uncharacterized protein n=1 Tax=Batrachochytrium dendrobatidis (strain JAM81 / FGSC 10211) TaxID=684364 RepID=F4PCS4_BATDJ|nr:uncharacterized protein BATDEDRAFT_14415 [Batrachochytrium dendrobatidis JAM81]XP_006682349.1 uncharacterized protein BATDEDRAFT_14474 [Batrachochytrium dendrobatidis JAM81]EGF76888.1 hypothetical protein BATDEDRAFT_14415 [Batrachochytrium dendrobatidis JAM81]EGF76995.1 hypothetical protein BATDEDRAFT_14474 [Batrachochytrium dendrobatidis JAM81]|eukprot:XP_006682345.1 hypothetical protein BATDEDRAFT_14415 [Batrachochytrium dendrobatidis JAM81]